MKHDLTKREKRQLEVLSHYYPIDLDNRVITIQLFYDKASDMFDQHVGVKKHRKLNPEIVDLIESTSKKIPFSFKIDVNLKVNDYEGYDPKDILQSIKDSFEIHHYAYRSAKRIDKTKFAILSIFGVILLGLWALLSAYNILATETAVGKTLLEIIYTIPCVLFWEAIYVIFWPNEAYGSKHHKLLYLLNKISLFDKKMKRICFMDKKAFMEGWEDISLKKTFYRLSFMIIATLLLAFAILNIIACIDVKYSLGVSRAFWITTMSITTINAFFGIVAGITSLSLYLEKGKIRKYSTLICIILLATCIVNMVLTAILFASIKASPVIIVFSALILVCAIYLSVCNILLKRDEKKNSLNIGNLFDSIKGNLDK